MASDDRLAAVLFDMDGTLVDSEKIWDVALHELAAHYGGDAVRAGPARDGRHQHGRLDADAARRPRPAASIRHRRRASGWLEHRVKELFARGRRVAAGARELLARVARGRAYPLALVTATRRHLVEVALLTLGADNFDAVVCRGRGRPDQAAPGALPDRGAGCSGPTAAGCVAIEDSPTGVASARAAGCAVLAVPARSPLDPEGVTQVGQPARRRRGATCAS